MAELRSRLLPLFRRSSASSARSSTSSTNSLEDGPRSRSKTSLLLIPKRKGNAVEGPVYEEDEVETLPSPLILPPTFSAAKSQSAEPLQTPDTSLDTAKSTPAEKPFPKVTVEEPTPDLLAQPTKVVDVEAVEGSSTTEPAEGKDTLDRPDAPPRGQSLVHSSQTRFIKTLLEANKTHPQGEGGDYFGGPPSLSANMLHRKVWVKRQGGSPTLVGVHENDLVDDVRDVILKKYANSLGRTFDSPDVTLRIVPRDHSHRHSHGERTLGPEEPVARTLDAYYPGGQTVEEALLIDIPQRRTPRHSPRINMAYYIPEDIRPGEGGTDYFPPMPPGASSPRMMSSHSVASGQTNHHSSIAILNTGQIPALPSPGGRGTRHQPHHRPKYNRTNTQSPTVASTPAAHSDTRSAGIPPAPLLPTPPISSVPQRTATPEPAIASPRPLTTRLKRNLKKGGSNRPSLPQGLLDGAVPPINVLIVEDNIINLKLLEAFMKRLKVRWHTAMNGREAVNKWRAGGFHLVLMDIQLPIMNGLEATKEIRRLERVNGVGVLTSSVSGRNSATGNRSADGEAGEEHNDEEFKAEDRLMNTALFKSPVIIVALTASSLQSDRHEALAAGCNDFLTKPVNFVWLERKVMEWGCMQALIDFDGWRKWKDFSQGPTPSSSSSNPMPSSSTNTSPVSNSKDSPTSVVMAVRTGRKSKRSSLGAHPSSLSGVVEDSEASEGSSGKAIAAGA